MKAKTKTPKPPISKAAMAIIDNRIEQEEHAAKLLSRKFGITGEGVPPAIDAVLMAKLHDALDLIDEDLREACWQRGLLSSGLIESLRMARFLSFALPLARAAQTATGVPASILIAEAYLVSGSHLGSNNDVFGSGREFASALDAFLDHASSLKSDADFQAVLNASRDPAQYIKEVALWSQRKEMIDIPEYIATHGLAECDSLRGIA